MKHAKRFFLVPDVRKKYLERLVPQNAKPVNDEPLSPEQKLLAAYVRRNIDDAQGIVLANEYYWSGNTSNKRDARAWFRMRSNKPWGWQWVIDHLKIPAHIAKRIEAEARLNIEDLNAPQPEAA